VKTIGTYLASVSGALLFASGCSGAPVDSAELAGGETQAVASAEEALVGSTDVGIILDGGANCPGADNNVELYLDDEDDNNNNQRSGWFGQFTSTRNTTLRFCRVSGAQFRKVKSPLATANYAVLQLGTSCPNGSFSATRYFDNEDDASGGPYSKGDISPNQYGGNGGNNLWMKLCVFAADNTSGSATPFPDLGFSYGVFGSGVPQAKATGYVYTDNEDHNNNNSVSGFPTNFDTSAFMTTSHKNGGTKLFTVRVR
jgi:hypothetical protein